MVEKLMENGRGDMLEVPPVKGEQSARRVLRLLKLIGEHGEHMTAKSVARYVGSSLPTAYHLINSLVQEGYVERIPGRKGYRLGPVISMLYQRSLGNGDLASDVGPVLDELAHRTGQRIYLAAYSEGEVKVVEKKCGPGSPRMPDAAFRDAEHALALGKVLLAGSPEEDLDAYGERKSLKPLTTRTITNPELLRTCLNQVRSEGYATDLEEFASGFCCVAAPVYGGDGDVEAAIGLSAPARRFRAEARSLARLVVSAGREASSIRGHDGQTG